jgi:hypothetical protein
MSRHSIAPRKCYSVEIHDTHKGQKSGTVVLDNLGADGLSSIYIIIPVNDEHTYERQRTYS